MAHLSETFIGEHTTLMHNTHRQPRSGSVQFITRRVAVGIAAVVAFSASTVALAGGSALTDRGAQGKKSGTVVERAHVTRELSKLNASAAQMEPRIASLSSHVGEMRDVHARLKKSKASKHALKKVSKDLESHDGLGGPELPARPCVESTNGHSAQGIEGTRLHIACLTETLELLEQEAAMHKTVLSSVPGRLPVDGARFRSRFGNRIDPFKHRVNFHSGIDLAAKTGTPILATAGGRVVFSGQKNGYGKVIEIDHGNQLVTRYAHASRLIAKKGDVVEPRQHIADVGSTGRSTGPHLHFEVLEKGVATDPTTYLSLFEGTTYG
jgi:murein DD-endopeptidase MepM/ murein hydrolase activator NlpD